MSDKAPESKKTINISTEQIQTALNNLNAALNKAQKLGAFEMQESHQLYEDLRLITLLVANHNNLLMQKQKDKEKVEVNEN